MRGNGDTKAKSQLPAVNLLMPRVETQGLKCTACMHGIHISNASVEGGIRV